MLVPWYTSTPAQVTVGHCIQLLSKYICIQVVVSLRNLGHEAIVNLGHEAIVKRSPNASCKVILETSAE